MLRVSKASSVFEVLAATIAPCRLPPHESDELGDLREVARLQTWCEVAKRNLANEVDLRSTAETNITRTIDDFYTRSDCKQNFQTWMSLPPDRDHALQQLKDYCGTSEADCAAAMRYVEQESVRVKAGHVACSMGLTKLWQYLKENDRGTVSTPSPRRKALLVENASWRRANSIFCRNSAEHGMDADALVLSTARRFAIQLGIARSRC
ncbi:hypothetical protein PHMEG_00015319 [Phytophthora megakarya]|uniref:Uncharacterized protein n=1 Tax=Phytophthora megakarya TaxID=4795 RepID=A0A225W1N5_9STRA|nr:hypothetical protein PHMEG_00015319 [Phytophthora megakarya]